MAKENDGQFTQISSSMNLTGDISGSSDIRIAGKIKGNIETTGDVVIENSGYVEGVIKSKNAMIAGTVFRMSRPVVHSLPCSSAALELAAGVRKARCTLMTTMTTAGTGLVPLLEQ